jgi:hypothetical protein
MLLCNFFTEFTFECLSSMECQVFSQVSHILVRSLTKITIERFVFNDNFSVLYQAWFSWICFATNVIGSSSQGVLDADAVVGVQKYFSVTLIKQFGQLYSPFSSSLSWFDLSPVKFKTIFLTNVQNCGIKYFTKLCQNFLETVKIKIKVLWRLVA